MALSDNQEATRAAMAEAFRVQMETLFPLPEELSEAEKDKIRAADRAHHPCFLPPRQVS